MTETIILNLIWAPILLTGLIVICWNDRKSKFFQQKIDHLKELHDYKIGIERRDAHIEYLKKGK